MGLNTSLDVAVQTRDPTTRAAVAIPNAEFAQFITTGSQALTLYPNVAVTPNVSVSTTLGREWRLEYTLLHDGSGSAIYSTSYAHLL